MIFPKIKQTEEKFSIPSIFTPPFGFGRTNAGNTASKLKATRYLLLPV